MKRVFGYLRVSGKGQLDGDGFDRQRDAIKKFCESKGYVVSRWFEEKAVSGTVDGLERPAFAEMMAACGVVVDTVIVERADRLARDLIVSELIISEATKLNIKIIEAASDTELTDSSDPTRVLIRQLLAALAEWDKSVTVKKMRVARQRIRSQGLRCEGRKPLENKKNGPEILDAILHFRDSGFGYQKIADKFNKEGILTPKGKEWNRSSIYDICRRVKNIDSLPRRREALQSLPGALPELYKT